MVEIICLVISVLSLITLIVLGVILSHGKRLGILQKIPQGKKPESEADTKPKGVFFLQFLFLLNSPCRNYWEY